MATCATTPTISADYLYEIKSALGYPSVEYLDWGDKTDEYIKRAILTRVLRIYYTYFPIKVETSHGVNGIFEIDYPEDPFVFRKLRHFYNYKTDGLSNFNNPFFLQTQVLYRSSSPYLKPWAMQEMVSRLTTMESLVDFGRSLKVEEFPTERKLKGFTETSGTLLVQWAAMSHDFGLIPYNHIDNAIKLAKGYLMLDAANLRAGAQIQASKILLDTNTLIQMGTKYVEEAESFFKNRIAAILVK